MRPLSASIYTLVCSLFPQDDASGVLHGPALCAPAAGGPALVPGPPGHPHLLPGQRGMEVPADLGQNHRQRLTVRVVGGWRGSGVCARLEMHFLFDSAGFCNAGPEAKINPDDKVQALTEVKHIKGIEYPQWSTYPKADGTSRAFSAVANTQ